MNDYLEEVNAKISKAKIAKKKGNRTNKKDKEDKERGRNKTYSTQNDTVKKIDVENNFFELGKKRLPYPTKKKHEWSEIKIQYMYKYFKNRSENDRIEDIKFRPIIPYYAHFAQKHYRATAKILNNLLEKTFSDLCLTSIQDIRSFFSKVKTNYE